MSSIGYLTTIWNQVVQAYYEPSKNVPNVVLPPHPVPNPDSKRFKYNPWPDFLNRAYGFSFSRKEIEDYSAFAQLKEPLEHVTPLHAAAMNSPKNVFRLLGSGAKVDARDIRGQTPAYWAAYYGKISSLMMLANAGADLHRRDNRGKTLLRAAAKYGQDDVVSFLASHRVNLNVCDGRGLTPLHLAAFHQRFSTYQKLLSYGADPTIKDRMGRTAEDLLYMKCAEIYHKRCFLSRLFSSPKPPYLTPGRIVNSILNN